MGLIKNFETKKAVKLIKHYTGQVVTPKFIATCDASIAPNWRGVVVIDDHTLWLVNRLGARGVAISNIDFQSTNRQYRIGSKGYPSYHFSFDFIEGQGSFSIFPITEESGREMELFLRNFNK